MALGVIRLEPLKAGASKHLLDHVRGNIRPETAYVREHLGVDVLCVDPGPKSFDEAISHALGAVRGAGKRPALGVSFLMAGGPDTDDVHADESTIPADAPATLALGRPWTLADCRRFMETGRELILEGCPGAHVLSAVHLDEKAVHVHHETVACVRQPDGTWRVGNAPVREGLVRLAGGFAEANEAAREKLRAREATANDEATIEAGRKPKRRQRWIDHGPDHVYLDYRAQMRLIHDLYAERFAEFGIVRGEGGKKRYHERVDRGKGLEAKLVAIKREAEAAEKRAADAQRSVAEQRESVIAELAEQRDRGQAQVDTAQAAFVKQRDRDRAELAERETAAGAEREAAEKAAREAAERQAAAEQAVKDAELRAVLAEGGAEIATDREREAREAVTADRERRRVLAAELAELDAKLADKRGELGDLDERAAKLDERDRAVALVRTRMRQVAGLGARAVRALGRHLQRIGAELADREARVEAFERGRAELEAAAELTRAAAVKEFQAETESVFLRERNEAAAHEAEQRRQTAERAAREAEARRDFHVPGFLNALVVGLSLRHGIELPESVLAAVQRSAETGSARPVFDVLAEKEPETRAGPSTRREGRAQA